MRLMNHTVRFGYFLLPAVFLLIMSLSASGQSSAPIEELSEQIRSTNRLILDSMGTSAAISNTDASGVENLPALIKSRAAAFSRLIEADPAQALELALPDNTTAHLRRQFPQIFPLLETHGRWEGFLDTLRQCQ